MCLPDRQRASDTSLVFLPMIDSLQQDPLEPLDRSGTHSSSKCNAQGMPTRIAQRQSLHAAFKQESSTMNRRCFVAALLVATLGIPEAAFPWVLAPMRSSIGLPWILYRLTVCVPQEVCRLHRRVGQHSRHMASGFGAFLEDRGRPNTAGSASSSLL